MSTAKKILFLFKQAPHGTSHAPEELDMLLMASTFALDISVLFLADGVLQLKSQQNTQAIDNKNFSATFKALNLYDIEKIYVAQDAVQKYSLNVTDLVIPVTLLTNTQVAEIMQLQDTIVSF